MTPENRLKEITRLVSYEEASNRADELMSEDHSLSLEDAMKKAINEVYMKKKTEEMLKDRPDLREKMNKFRKILKDE